jgi:transposase-like protein
VKAQFANLPAQSSSDRTGADLPERWSAQRKTEIVLRMIQGEVADEISREIGIAAQLLEDWRRVFIECGKSGLKSRSDPDGERELIRARAKIGELTMRLELIEEVLRKKESGEEARRLGR